VIFRSFHLCLQLHFILDPSYRIARRFPRWRFRSQSTCTTLACGSFHPRHDNLEALPRRSISALTQSFLKTHRRKTLHCLTFLVHPKAPPPACQFSGPSNRRCGSSCTYSSISESIRSAWPTCRDQQLPGKMQLPIFLPATLQIR
jgi:hypothetical protein